MSARNSAGSSFAPFCIRMALGVMFVWAGLGKLLDHMSVQGADAALLANMGVLTPGGEAPPAISPTPPGEQLAPPKPAENPAAPQTPPAAPKPEAPREVPPGQSPQDPGDKKDPTGPGIASLAAEPFVLMRLQTTEKTYSAGDFASPVQVRTVYMLALGLHRAAHPAPHADGSVPMPLWPAFAGKDSWPVYCAWAVTLVELVGGIFLLVGFATRFSALLITGVMAGAIWLTQVGPAIQAGTTTAGFLPTHGAWERDAAGTPLYMTLMLQFVLMMTSFALVFLGSGGMALDRALFGGSSSPPPKPKPAAP